MKRLLLPVAATFLAGTAFADWPGDVKWDQLQVDPPTVFNRGAESYVDYDNPLNTGAPTSLKSADDFLCTEKGYITDIEFAGWSYMGTPDDKLVDKFKVQFWSDVPAVPGSSESHPGQLLYDYDVSKADLNDPLKIGWYVKQEGNGTPTDPKADIYKIDLPRDKWFLQEGGATHPAVYWISIQGIMTTDGYQDFFYWAMRDPKNHWGDDAAFAGSTPDFTVNPWDHWATNPDGNNMFYEGLLPNGYQSRDLAFKLTGTAVPEPASLMVLGLGALALIRKRK